MSSHLGSKAKALKNKITDKVGGAIAAPVVAYHGVKSAVANRKYKQIVGTRNYKNRTDDTNKYRGINYWSENKN